MSERRYEAMTGEIFISIYKQAMGYFYEEDAGYSYDSECGRDPVTRQMKYKKVRATKKTFMPPNFEAVKLIMALKDPDCCYAEELRKTGCFDVTEVAPEIRAAFIEFSTKVNPSKVLGRSAENAEPINWDEIFHPENYPSQQTPEPAQPTKQ
jgi:hypothetical protein